MIDIDSILVIGKTREEYLSSYLNIIDSAKDRGLVKPDKGYYEVHHILPRSKGGKDDKENLVLLTMQEHIICHVLLYLAYPEDSSISRAASMMVGMRRDGKSFLSIINSDTLIEIKNKIQSAAGHTWEIKVVCLDDSGSIIRIYDSLTEAKRLDNFSISKISAVLSGHRQKTGGYYWKKLLEYADGHENEIKNYYNDLDNGIIPNLVKYNKKIVCCSLDGEIEAIYNSIKEAETVDGYDARQISAVLVGKQKTSREHLWYRYNDYADKEKLELFEKSGEHKKSTPIKTDYTVIKFKSDLSYKKSYSSLREAAEDIGVERRGLRLSSKDAMLEFDGYYYMKASEYNKLYE